jgi:hypothetical protein
MIVFLILLPVSVALLAREVLILGGLLKDPILRGFEKYGDLESVYYPLPALLLWSGLLLFSLAPIAAPALGSTVPLALPGLLLLAAAVWSRLHPELARQHPGLLMRYPRWYADLRERTTRYERRRLAYLWLTLPWRLRLRYNGSDSAFNHWADFVIMATMRYDEQASLGDHPSRYHIWDY